ncbi:MAG: c-type cytochrome [Proteobacteria bacterium]|nr:c-type cytochrome [Pseudomonadota bacterium]
MREVNEVLALVPDSAHGAQIFTYCASCHTESVNRLPEGWVPKIAGQHPRYLVRQLIDYRHSVRWDARMEPVAQGHGVRGLQDIADVVAYVASQPAEWGGEAKAVSGNGRTFYDDHCSGCHGSGGEGSDARLVPRIAGQDFAYVLRQLHDVVDGRRPNMRASHLRALEDLDVVQLVELSGYVSSLRAHATAGAASLTRSQGAARVGDSS